MEPVFVARPDRGRDRRVLASAMYIEDILAVYVDYIGDN